MFKLLYTFILILFLASCSSGVNREHNSQKHDSIASDTNIVFSKVAVLKIPFPEELNKKVHIFNIDMSVYMLRFHMIVSLKKQDVKLLKET